MLALLGNKFVQYGLLAVLAILVARLWGNHQWEKGEATGRVNAERMAEKNKKVEWKQAEDHIAAEREQARSERAAAVLERENAAAASAQLKIDRALMADIHQKNLTAIETQKEVTRAQILTVAPSELDGTLRLLSNDPAISATQ